MPQYFRCQTKHRLTGETRISATAGKLVITGMFCFILYLYLLQAVS